MFMALATKYKDKAQRHLCVCNCSPARRSYSYTGRQDQGEAEAASLRASLHIKGTAASTVPSNCATC